MSAGGKRRKCTEEEVFNPVDNRCVKRDSEIGRELVSFLTAAALREMGLAEKNAHRLRNRAYGEDTYKRPARRQKRSLSRRKSPSLKQLQLQIRQRTPSKQRSLSRRKSPSLKQQLQIKQESPSRHKSPSLKQLQLQLRQRTPSKQRSLSRHKSPSLKQLQLQIKQESPSRHKSPSKKRTPSRHKSPSKKRSLLKLESDPIRYPDASEWPSVDSPEFLEFVGDMLTGNLFGYRTVDYTMSPAPEQNDCTSIGKQAIELEKYQALLTRIIGPKSPLKRLLYIASTGSGKTCTIHAIAAAYGYEKKIVVIVPGQAQANEILKQSVKCPGPIRDELVDARHLNWENEKDRSKIMRDLNGRFDVLTYIQAGNRIKKDERYFDGKLVFMDEVHNLVDSPVEVDGHIEPKFEKMPANWRPSVIALYNTLGGARNAIIIGLTATPIVSRPEQLIMLINVLAGRQVLNQDTFMLDFVEDGRLTTDDDKLDVLRKAFTGIIAIYDNKNDINRFPSVEHIDENVGYSVAQTTKMLKAKKPQTLVNIDPMAARKASISKLQDDKTLKKVSPKFSKIIRNVKSIGDGKQIIFSDQKRTGAEGLLELFLQRGYVLYPETSAAGKSMIYLGNVGDKPLSKKKMEAQLKVFNHPDNAHGEIYSLAILSSKYAEGVDFVGVRAVHFVEQQADPGRFEQVVGRARRFCSHRQLNYPDEWTAKIFTYTSYDEDKEMPQPDYDNKRIRESKKGLIDDVMSVAGSTALDCRANAARTGFICRDSLKLTQLGPMHR